ncbi:DUF6414 family protein, partial [Priestia megaterium]
MKEIIYLDTELMNSMLAQLENGLIMSFSAEQNNQQTESVGQQSARGEKAGLSAAAKFGTGPLGGINLSLGGNYGAEGRETESTSRSFLEGEKDILNKTFDDYALDILSEKLVEGDLLKHGPNFQEGDLYLGEATYKFYDFNLIKNVLDYELMEQIMLSDIEDSELSYKEALQILKKSKPTARDRERMPEAHRVVNAYT